MQVSCERTLAYGVFMASLFGIAVPAAAVVQTFASYSPTTAAKNFRFVNSGNAGGRLTDAIVYTTATSTATITGAAPVKFSFLIPTLQPFVTGVNALYTLNGTIDKGSPVASSGFFSQSGYSGSFSFVTTSAITVSGANFITHTYAAGSNLLSGTFVGGNMVGNVGGTSGSSFASGPSGAGINFMSDFLDFTNVLSLDRSTAMTAVSLPFGKHAGANGALNSFRAVTGGQFSSDPVPVANFLATVPEPESWAMLCAGFGLVGVSVRRRRNRQIVAA